MRYQKLWILLMLITLPHLGNTAENTVPHYMNFQSVLRDDNGSLIKDGFISLEFKILDQDGKQLYYELQPGVQVIRGTVNVNIGEGIKPGSSPSAPTGGIPLTAFDPSSGDKLLQMRIDGNLPGEPMSLNTVPYAMYAEKALNIIEDIALDQLPALIATDDEVGKVASDLLTQINAKVSKSGDSTIDGNLTITGKVNGVDVGGLQAQVGGKVAKGGDTMTGDLSMDTDINCTAAVEHPCRVDGVDVSVDLLRKDGSIPMTGDLNMGGKNITNVPDDNNVPYLSGGNFNLGRTLHSHETRIGKLEEGAPDDSVSVQQLKTTLLASGSQVSFSQLKASPFVDLEKICGDAPNMDLVTSPGNYFPVISVHSFANNINNNHYFFIKPEIQPRWPLENPPVVAGSNSPRRQDIFS